MSRFSRYSRSLLFCTALLAGGDKNDFKPDGSGITISDQYSGKHPDRAREVLAILKDHKITALKTIHQQMGLAQAIKIPIRIVDFASVKGALAETDGSGSQISMVFCMDEIVRTNKDKQDIELTYTHELVHAYLRQYITSKNYDLIPRWLQEGIAVYGAVQTDDKIQREMEKTPSDPMSFAKELEKPKQGNPGYVESSLAFEYIKKKYSDAKVKELTAKLIAINKGQNVQTIVQSVIGESYTGFMSNAHAFAIEYVRKKILEIQKQNKK